VILDAEAAVKTPGPDSVVAGGQKSYAPRVSTGRLTADAVLLLKDENVLLITEQVKFKDNVGVSHTKQTLAVVDVRHVVGLEYDHTGVLKALNVPEPPPPRDTEYRPGVMVG
jgi:hypothetical protein